MLPRSNPNARVPIRLSIGDGLRFGIGFFLAPLVVWLLVIAFGMWSGELATRFFGTQPSTASAAPK